MQDHPKPDSNARPSAAVPPEGDAALRQLSQTITEALKNLLLLIPGQTRAAKLRNGDFGMILSLDKRTHDMVDDLLTSLSIYHQEPIDAAEAHEPINARVLVVDDDAVTRMLIRRTLERHPGCSVVEACDGLDALNVLAHGEMPHVCITDISMPEMDGLRLIQKIRSIPHLRDLPVIVCSSVKERDAIVKAAGMNVTRYVIKPFTAASISGHLKETIAVLRSKSEGHLKDICSRLSLKPKDCIELVERIATSLGERLTQIRACISQGQNYDAAQTLSGLVGTCAVLAEPALNKAVLTAHSLLADGEIFAALEELERVESEQRRVKKLAWELRSVVEWQEAERARSHPASMLEPLIVPPTSPR